MADLNPTDENVLRVKGRHLTATILLCKCPDGHDYLICTGSTGSTISMVHAAGCTACSPQPAESN